MFLFFFLSSSFSGDKGKYAIWRSFYCNICEDTSYTVFMGYVSCTVLYFPLKKVVMLVCLVALKMRLFSQAASGSSSSSMGSSVLSSRPSGADVSRLSSMETKASACSWDTFLFLASRWNARKESPFLFLNPWSHPLPPLKSSMPIFAARSLAVSCRRVPLMWTFFDLFSRNQMSTASSTSFHREGLILFRPGRYFDWVKASSILCRCLIQCDSVHGGIPASWAIACLLFLPRLTSLRALYFVSRSTCLLFFDWMEGIATSAHGDTLTGYNESR